MNVLCLGGAGRICREAILDLAQSSDFERITVADANEAAGREVVAWLDHLDPARPQDLDVLDGRRVQQHPRVHRRGHQHGRQAGRQQ